MAHQEIADRWFRSNRYVKGTSQRFKTLDVLDKVRENKFYDILDYDYSVEEVNGKKIPLKDRRPSVQCNLTEIVTNQVASLLFGDDHAPHIHYWAQGTGVSGKPLGDDHKATQLAIEALVYEAGLYEVMLEASKTASSGSAALIIDILEDGRPHVRVMAGKYCQPLFAERNPDRLESLTMIYNVKGSSLDAEGYDIAKDKLDETYWLKIELSELEETRSYPLPQRQYERLGDTDPDDPTKTVRWRKDPEMSGAHGFKFLPAIWLRSGIERDRLDGNCLYGKILDIQVELDYLISQSGRGYKYCADPMLVTTAGELGGGILLPEHGSLEGDSSVSSTTIEKSVSSVVSLPFGADMKMLEITGQGLAGMDDHSRMLREYALEVLSGMKADQDHAKGGNAQSGRALDILHQALKWLVERMRICYGRRGLLPLVKMLLQALIDGSIKLDEIDGTAGIKPNLPLRLFWPVWHLPQGQELQNHLDALNRAAGGTQQVGKQIITMHTAAREAAMALGLPNPDEEANAVEAENPAEDQEKVKTLHLNPPSPPKPPTAGK
jgi:hypothetical protein